MDNGAHKPEGRVPEGHCRAQSSSCKAQLLLPKLQQAGVAVYIALGPAPCPHLVCQLARVAQHNGLDLGRVILDSDLLQDGDDKHGRLAHARLGLAQDVHTEDGLGYALVLDCGSREQAGVSTCMIDKAITERCLRWHAPSEGCSKPQFWMARCNSGLSKKSLKDVLWMPT